MSGSPDRVTAGRVGRPHGLDGSFYVTGPRPRLLVEGAAVTVGGRTLEITRRAGTDARPIVRQEGLEDREAVAELRGLEWWAHELEGCAVYAGERWLGTVARLIELPSCEALEVSRAGSGEPLLVPMVKDAIGAVDVAAERIEVRAEFLGLEEAS